MTNDITTTRDATYIYTTSKETGRTVKTIDLDNPKLRNADRLGAEAFFASDPADTESAGNNPFEWGTPEFTVWASSFETERTAWISDQHDLIKDERYG